jgi:hypothetical protein
MQKAQVSQPGHLKETTMKTLMLIPTLAVALVTASASLSAALACVPGPGQCCTGDPFVENGRFCRVTNCRGSGQFSTITTTKNCSVLAKPIRGYRLPIPGPLH